MKPLVYKLKGIPTGRETAVLNKEFVDRWAYERVVNFLKFLNRTIKDERTIDEINSVLRELGEKND